MSHILTDFSSSISRHGLTPPERIVADGRIHRFRSGPEKAENGFYRLSLVAAHHGGDIGFGTIGCWKRGLNEKWCSRQRGEIGDADRTAIRKIQAQHKKAEAEEAAAAVERGKAIWSQCGAADPAQPYLVAKGIVPLSVRQNHETIDIRYASGDGEKQRQYVPKGNLVVPVYRDGGLVSLQFIAPDGTKRFLKGGGVEGGYASVGAKDSPKDRIVIAEGYATGVSLHLATGLAVAVAFNAGNLAGVAKAIRAKYPDAEIVIGADADQWTVVRGKPVNVGVEAAKKAASAIHARVCWPVFAADDPEKPSDWNDYAKRHGNASTLAAFHESLERSAGPPSGREIQASDQRTPDDRGPPPAPACEPPSGEMTPPNWVTEGPSDWALDRPNGEVRTPEGAVERHRDANRPTDWRARLIPGKEVAEGHPFPFDRKSKTNAYLFLKHHERFAGLLCYNEFTDAVMLTRRPPWDDGTGNFSPRHVRDDDFFMLAAHLEYCDLSASKETAADAAVRVAKENAINPPREYLARLEWDRRPRLDTWLTYYLGADEQPGEYLALVGSKWLIGAVSRVFDPGCKFDSVLILEGTQGLGKSMALRSLSTFNGQDFFLDSVGDIRSKDTLMTMQGKLIVEIAELASFRKSENEEIKAFITRQVDEYRPPYGRTVVRRPRYFVLAGSTNELDEGYLTDDTGNRRYWPVKCKSIDAASVERDSEQLWAEAVTRYKSGERTWLAAEEAHFSAKEQKSRFMEDAWQERIAEISRHEWTLKIDEVLTKLELKPRDINNMVKKRVKNSLRQLGWHETRRAGEGRVWRRLDSESGGRAEQG